MRGEPGSDALEDGARPVPCLVAPTGLAEGLARFAAWYRGAGHVYARPEPQRRSRPVARRPRLAAQLLSPGRAMR